MSVGNWDKGRTWSWNAELRRRSPPLGPTLKKRIATSSFCALKSFFYFKCFDVFQVFPCSTGCIVFLVSPTNSANWIWKYHHKGFDNVEKFSSIDIQIYLLEGNNAIIQYTFQVFREYLLMKKKRFYKSHQNVLFSVWPHKEAAGKSFSRQQQISYIVQQILLFTLKNPQKAFKNRF